MIHLETAHTINTVADFPDDFRVINGDGVVIVKDPATNEIVLQVPAATTIIFKRPNPPAPLQRPVPVNTVTGPPVDIPPAMQGGEGGS